MIVVFKVADDAVRKGIKCDTKPECSLIFVNQIVTSRSESLARTMIFEIEKRIAYLADQFGKWGRLLEFASEDCSYFSGNFSRFASYFLHERRFLVQS